MKYYGNISFVKEHNHWELNDINPHVCIKLKNLFLKIKKTAVCPFKIVNNLENSVDLLWFMERYPLNISTSDLKLLRAQKRTYEKNSQALELISLPEYKAAHITLTPGKEARDYQLKAAEFHAITKRYLLGDDLGLGKTLSAILTLLQPGTLPAVAVVQTHLTTQWQEEIKQYTSLSTHIIKERTPYKLPEADVYIFKYSQLQGWANFFSTGFFKSVIFDEAQELRRSESLKYEAAKILSNSVDYSIGLSATPIYNYGSEVYNILHLLKPDCLGHIDDFLREWAVPKGNHHIIKDPNALGSYLRDNHLFLRRTRQEVGRELPVVNKIIHTVGYDDEDVKKADQIAKELSLKVIHGASFMERGQAARDLDILIRHRTGVSKAREVAEYVKILLENNEPVVLAGWHREVYEIWQEELKDFNPVMFTGSESEAQKIKAKNAFISGETNLFIISLRSGVGLDGLQKRCRTIVIGELDWSPQVHNQLIGRVDRDGQLEQVTAIFLVSDYGSDPVIVDMLGLKASQANAIINPLSAPAAQFSDDSRIRMLAESFLKRKAA